MLGHVMATHDYGTNNFIEVGSVLKSAYKKSMGVSRPTKYVGTMDPDKIIYIVGRKS